MTFIYTVAHHTEDIDPTNDCINFGNDVEKIVVTKDTPEKDMISIFKRIPNDNMAIDNESFSRILECIVTYLDNSYISDMFLDVDLARHSVHIGIILDPNDWDKNTMTKTLNMTKLTPIVLVDKYEEIDTSNIIELHKAMDRRPNSSL